MGSSISLGKIFGIPIRLHYSWFIIFALITAALVTNFPAVYPLWQRITLGIVASLLFFISIIAHELAHSLIAIRNGIPVKSITLFIFGGVSLIVREATRPIVELLVAVVGPLSSLVIAGIFTLFYFLSTGIGEVVIAGLAQWLAFINVMLALFNLIPGFPLDGGRIFRAFLWMVKDYGWATRTATLTGRVIGFLFIFLGILIMIVIGQWYVGLWLALIGLFLENAASTSYRQALLREALEGFTARDVMSKDCPFITRNITLNQLVRDYILTTGQHYFVVVDDGKLEGIVTLHNIKSVPRERWDSAQIGEVMTPNNELWVVYPEEPAVRLLEIMDEEDINQLPVVEGGKVIGVVARDGLFRFLRLRTELEK